MSGGVKDLVASGRLVMCKNLAHQTHSHCLKMETQLTGIYYMLVVFIDKSDLHDY